MRDVLDRIEAKKAELDRLRPLSARALIDLANWYDVELTYTSNAIEGNTLTRQETAIVLEKGLTVSGKPLADHLEAIGHKEALAYVRQLASRGEAIREGDIREIHRLIMFRIDPDQAGRYSDHPRMISGSTVRLPSPAEVPPLMADFARWLSSAPSTPETAFAAHERLAVIHPFSDGNGRTARLLMNLVLLRGGYPPVVVGPDRRVAYLESLETLPEDRTSYEDFMAARLEESLDRHLEILGQGVPPRPAAGR